MYCSIMQYNCYNFWITDKERVIEKQLIVQNLDFDGDKSEVEDGFKDFFSRITESSGSKVEKSKIDVEIVDSANSKFNGDETKVWVNLTVNQDQYDRLNENFLKEDVIRDTLNAMLDNCTVDTVTDWCANLGLKVTDVTSIDVKPIAGIIINTRY